MPTYPQLGSGALSQFPVQKTRQLRTVVNQAADGSTIKLADPAAEVTEWLLTYADLSDAEAAALRAFFDDDAALFRVDGDDLATLAFFGAGEHHHFIVFLDVKFLHTQITSGASEMIFMNFLSRSSRATGPKMRVPRGFISASIITTALLSKRR